MNAPYSPSWFTQRRARALADNSQIAFETRLAIGHVPQSVVDFGCGDGALLQVWRDIGAKVVIGIDPHGPEQWRVQTAEGRPCLGFDAHHFRMDLARPIGFEAKVGLACCLEVAEHLPVEAAPTLIDSLTQASDRVLFSAATPGQGGEGHVNDQPPGYWMQMFQQRGFVMQDIVRWRLPQEVSWWYRRNVRLFCRKGSEIELPPFELLMPSYGQNDRGQKLHLQLQERMRWLNTRGLKVQPVGKLRIVGGQACIDKARSELGTCFMDEVPHRVDYGLWLDDDMAPDLQRDLLDLLIAAHQSGREALAGFAPKKMIPSTIAHSRSLWGPVLTGPGAPQQPFDSLGFGIIVVHRKAFERIDRWSRENQWHPYAVKPTMSGVRKPMRDYFRPVLGEPDPRFIDLNTGEWRRGYLNEDGSFCRRLLVAGGTLWAMPQAFCAHEGQFTFKREHVQ